MLPYFLPDPETGRCRGGGRVAPPSGRISLRGPAGEDQGTGRRDPAVPRVLRGGSGNRGRREYADAPANGPKASSGVRFLGRVGLDEAPRATTGTLLRSIVPSVCFETFGIILIEAFRRGAPVIARRIGPFPEIVASNPAAASSLLARRASWLAAMRPVAAETANTERD